LRDRRRWKRVSWPGGSRHLGEPRSPIRRTERTVDTAFSIVAQFQAEFRGVAEYYKLAFNRHRLGRLKYVMERSLTNRRDCSLAATTTGQHVTTPTVRCRP
jgi:hypothetical protein